MKLKWRRVDIISSSFELLVKDKIQEHSLQAFLLRHGENMVDCLGAEVDRIEKNLKQKHPEVQINPINIKADMP